MTYQCELIERPAQPALSIHARTAVQNLAQVLGQSYGTIAQYLGQMGKQPAGAPFVAYHNYESMDMQALDVEVGFPTPGPLPGKDTIQASEIPGGKAVSCLYIGPYAECGAAYEAMNQWIQANGYELTQVAYEFYLNDPSATPSEAPQTQIMMPLKAK